MFTSVHFITYKLSSASCSVPDYLNLPPTAPEYPENGYREIMWDYKLGNWHSKSFNFGQVKMLNFDTKMFKPS